MKNTLFLFLLIVCSCSNHENKSFSRLMLVDSLLDGNLIDSASVILGNIKEDELVTLEHRALYALLKTQMQDKNYILHTNDSLIRIAVNYYDKTKNLRLRAKSHYYLGRVYQDMNDIRGVVREFLTAMPLAEKTDDYYLTCLLQGNLGLLYADNGLLEEADSLYRCAGRLAKQRNDSSRWAMALLNIGKIGIERGHKFYGEAENDLIQALEIAKTSENGGIVKRKASELLGCLYERTGEISRAISFTKESIRLQRDTTKRYGGYLLLGSAYYKLGRYDSATIYLNRSLHSTNNYTKEGAYMRLADIAKRQNRLEDAILFDEKYMFYHKAALEEEAPVKLVTSFKDIIHQQTVNKYESFLVQYRFYILLLLILLFFTGALYGFRQRRIKGKFKALLKDKENLLSREKELRLKLRQKDTELESLNMKYEHSVNDRQKQKEYITKQNELIEEKESICSELCKLLYAKEQTIEMLNEKYLKPIIEDTPIYQKFVAIKKENCKNPDGMVRPDDADWEELLQELNNMTNNFTDRLAHRYVMLSKDDIRFCSLIKIGFKFGEMKDILACTLDAVYKREKAILKNKMKINTKTKLKAIVESM